ncbi:MAG TPA: PIG-L deacetylase family protein [Actinomycetota bacterium]|nr:PIG-L deacetylase family protein [Actinomycetota bacterium]
MADVVPEGSQGPSPSESVPTQGPVLAVFAHPDDAEISAGGTLGRWASEGREVHLLVLTNGDRGSEDPVQHREELARTRLAETEDAARLLGLAGATVLSNHDGELQNTFEVQSEIARAARRVRPTIVLTCDPTAWFFGNRYFNHSDHRTAGAVTLDAVFPGAGNPHFFAEQLAEGLSVWKVPEVWMGWTLEPNHYQDVTGFIDLKLKALAEHRSQVQGDMFGLFEEWLPAEAEENGRKIGVQHAEAFRVLQLE